MLEPGLKEDSDFASLNYLGIHKPAITPDEFMEMEIRCDRNPLEVKKYILDYINGERYTAFLQFNHEFG